MEICYKSKYLEGQKLYYLDKDTIKEATIVGIRATFKSGTYYKSSPFEEFYAIRDSNERLITLTEKDLEKNYFLTKKDIAKHIIDQME